VAGFCEYGDEPSCSCAMELVSYRYPDGILATCCCSSSLNYIDKTRTYFDVLLRKSLCTTVPEKKLFCFEIRGNLASNPRSHRDRS
jgi:hypothetical protein